MTAAGPGQARLRRRGFWLEYASMAWMTAEAAVAITAGILASSIAPTGFGLDSVIEFFAAAVVVGELRGQAGSRQERALRLIGVTFFALAAGSIRDLVVHARPGSLRPGWPLPPPPCWSCHCSLRPSCAPAGQSATAP